MVTFLSPIFPNNNSLLGTLLSSRLNKLTTILSGISSSSFFFLQSYLLFLFYVYQCLPKCMYCTMYVPGIYRGQKRESGPLALRCRWLSHLSSSRGSFFQEADFPFLKSELALRVALTDRLWERWHDSSTREPVKVEFYLENPSPPPCGKAPNERLHRGRSWAIFIARMNPAPLPTF